MKEKENFNLRTKEPNFHNHNLPINYNLKEKIIEKKTINALIDEMYVNEKKMMEKLKIYKMKN